MIRLILPALLLASGANAQLFLDWDDCYDPIQPTNVSPIPVCDEFFIIGPQSMPNFWKIHRTTRYRYVFFELDDNAFPRLWTRTTISTFVDADAPLVSTPTYYRYLGPGLTFEF